MLGERNSGSKDIIEVVQMIQEQRVDNHAEKLNEATEEIYVNKDICKQNKKT